MQKVSTSISKWLATESVILDTDIELYSYAVHRVILDLVPIGISTLWGILFGMVWENIVFAVTFMAIRKFSGGFHFENPKECLIVSSGILWVAAALLKYHQIFYDTLLFVLVVLAAATSVCRMSPIDSKAHPLSDNERKVFKGITKTIVFLMVCIYVALVCVEKYWSVPIGLGIVLAALLQVPSIYIDRA